MQSSNDRIQAILDAGQEQWRKRRGLDAPQLDLHAVLTAARQRTLLEDFGRGEFRDGLDPLLAALNASPMTPAKHRELSDVIVSRLQARLRIRDWVKKNPPVVDEDIREPIIVTGADPAGVGFLGRVLAEDVFNRAPLRWEAASVAPAGTASSRGHDPRIAAYQGEGAGLPAHCEALLANAFADPFTGWWDPGEFQNIWLEADQDAGYEFHRLQLQILQSAWPTQQWILHSTSHLGHLDALLRTYPDARVVWIHRDPAHVVQRIVDTHAEAEDQATGTQLERIIRRSLEARNRHPETSFFDLQYVELVDDPVGAVERFYRDWGIQLPDLSRWRMQAMLGEPGTVPAAVMPDRVSVKQLRDRMADYVSTFEIPSELSLL